MNTKTISDQLRDHQRAGVLAMQGENPILNPESIFIQAAERIEALERELVARQVAELERDFVATQASDFVADVRAFHEKYRQAYDGPPRFLSPDETAFRLKFAREETQELEEAMADGNAEEIIDALADKIFVDLGTAYLYGFDIQEAWRRVVEKNMQKIPPAEGEFKIRKPEGWTPPCHADLVPDAISDPEERFKYWWAIFKVIGANIYGESLSGMLKEDWRQYFLDGYSPRDAIDEDMSNA